MNKYQTKMYLFFRLNHPDLQLSKLFYDFSDSDPTYNLSNSDYEVVE